VAVFEPRSYTAQRREFQEERYDEATALSPQRLVERWQTGGTPAAHMPVVDDIVAHLRSTARPGDIIMIMSNGGFGGIHEKLLNALGD
jgi:UDP-N-acetylmuramate: L-alanyl-gamma-D-glutamyl-meso-diaminopimelate ligase